MAPRAAAPARAHLATAPPLAASTLHADGMLRCWGSEFTLSGPAMSSYHDTTWGRTPAPGNAQSLYKQLVLQTFQAGLSWQIILNKEAGFAARFEQWDYARVARWTDADIAAAMADAGIVRNGAKIRAAVANAQLAVALDAQAPGGFERFCWRTCGCLPITERLLQHGSRSAGGSYMRSTERTDFDTADGVHPTKGVTAAVAAFKKAGFKFMGPAATLSFMQAAGYVNHHKPDCCAFAAAEQAYQTAAQAAGVAGGAAPAVADAAPTAAASRKRRRA